MEEDKHPFEENLQGKASEHEQKGGGLTDWYSKEGAEKDSEYCEVQFVDMKDNETEQQKPEKLTEAGKEDHEEGELREH